MVCSGMTRTNAPRFPDLTPARMHEAGGPGALGFALAQAGRQLVRTRGRVPPGGRRETAREATREGTAPAPVVWITPRHAREMLLPAGCAPLLDPARLLMVRAPGQTDLLWAAEEALRAGVATLVVAAPDQALNLTQGRRLQLAAEAGQTTGLLLIREGAGCNAAESRWHCAPLWDPAGGGGALQHWRCVKNKKGVLPNWVVRFDEKTGSVHLVSASGEREGLAAAPA